MCNTIFDMGWSFEKTVEELIIHSIWNKIPYDLSYNVESFYPILSDDCSTKNEMNHKIISMLEEKLEELRIWKHGDIYITDVDDILGVIPENSSKFEIDENQLLHDETNLYSDVIISKNDFVDNCNIVDRLTKQLENYGKNAIEVAEKGEKILLQQVYDEAITKKWLSLKIMRA